MAFGMLDKPVSRALLKDGKQKAVKAERQDTYRFVERRDGMCCRACNRRVVKTADLRLDKLEHHHVRGRGFKGAEHSSNIACLCREHHDERHVSRILSITGNADSLLMFERHGKVWHG